MAAHYQIETNRADHGNKYLDLITYGCWGAWPADGAAVMNQADKEQSTSRYNRRAFLRRVGARAGAVALSGGVGAAIAPRAVAAPSATVHTSPTKFGRIFPRLPAFSRATDAVRAALSDLGKPGGLLDADDKLSKGPVQLITDPSLSVNNPNNPTHTAGSTFFGQVRRPRHHLRHDFAAGRPYGPGRDGQRAHTVARS